MANSHEIVLIHVGAGKHSIKNSKSFKKLLKKACTKGILALNDENLSNTTIYESSGKFEIPTGSMKALSDVSKLIEGSLLTNASIGSSLASDGQVYNDAQILLKVGTSQNCYFGMTGIKNYKFPISRCLNFSRMAEITFGDKELGVTKPCFIVDGGVDYHSQSPLEFFEEGKCDNDTLITNGAERSYHYWDEMRREQSESFEENYQKMNHNIEYITDTIGVSIVDKKGNILNGTSSGGNMLKNPGRIGCASVLGAGTFIMSSRDLPFYKNVIEPKLNSRKRKADEDLDDNGVIYEISLLATGNGEQIISSDISRYCCNYILSALHLEDSKNIYDSAELLSSSITELSTNRLYVGVTGLIRSFVDSQKTTPHQTHLLYAHTTENFTIAFKSSMESSFEYIFSENPNQDIPLRGQIVCVS
ncbi:hypothetical protein DASC09_063220 [Saccharomycopsis crataegensis]|uniref:Uncharacterized protein n=1 Tax=Saccharomycopsis crataegensis TaxID=43959 RepID=A0AAV5QY17_9ASCO|nr:hypothetical protein DASC09_063220 [Saccharomycopsis crataegensis]